MALSDVITVAVATAAAVLELLGGFFLNHAQCGCIVRLFAYLYGASRLVAFARLLTHHERSGCFGDVSLLPGLQALADTALAVGLYLSGSHARHRIRWAHLVRVSVPRAMLAAGIVLMATTPTVRTSALAGQQPYLDVQSLVGKRFALRLF